MDDEVKEKFAEMEAKIAALEAKHKDLAESVDHHVDRYYDHQTDLNKMIYASYFKTHPEFYETLKEFDDILSGKSKSSGEPER